MTKPEAPGGWRRSWRVRVAALALAALVAFVLVWFQPQKLWIDDRVDEAIPTVAGESTTTVAGDDNGGSTPTSPSTSAPPAEPRELSRGEFISRDHGTTGVARVLELSDGSQVLRLEGLDTDNGPDLYVYLTANPADGPEGAFDDDHLDLGRLKGNQGDQNYDIPPGTDLTRLSTVVIWCDRFDSAFGAADLTAS